MPRSALEAVSATTIPGSLSTILFRTVRTVSESSINITRIGSAAGAAFAPSETGDGLLSSRE
ncbi:hypothetical protein MACH24_10170 [Erythrobacter sp. Dej080120_24]|nr:hypothetical protein MACH24_10170 [Erythrobacter sp. Dej080120_24]